jgi:PAS fold
MDTADSQRLFDALLTLDAPVGFAVLDTSHRYLAINSVLASRHRRSVADHLGWRIEELAAEGSSGARAARVIDRVVDTGEAVHTDGSPERPGDETDVLRSSWFHFATSTGGRPPWLSSSWTTPAAGRPPGPCTTAVLEPASCSRSPMSWRRR